MLRTYRMLLEIMTPGERKRFWLLLGITFCLAAVEAGSVISILPFLRVLSDPGLIETNEILAFVYDAFGFCTLQAKAIASHCPGSAASLHRRAAAPYSGSCRVGALREKTSTRTM